MWKGLTHAEKQTWVDAAASGVADEAGGDGDASTADEATEDEADGQEEKGEGEEEDEADI